MYEKYENSLQSANDYINLQMVFILYSSYITEDSFKVDLNVETLFK